MIKLLKYKIKSIIYRFGFLKILFSPFKPFKIKFYFGDIQMGTPYFLPRIVYHDKKLGIYKYKPKKFGFDFITLGWKTKYDDYRHEWDPMLSFVAFNKQICIFIVGLSFDITIHYWESWLFYDKETKGTRIERLNQLFNLHSEKWNSYKDNVKEEIDYYRLILKPKYIKYLDEYYKNYKKVDDEDDINT